MVVASARALAQFVSPEAAAGPITLRRGDSVDQSPLVQRLSGVRVPQRAPGGAPGGDGRSGLHRRCLPLNGLGAGAHRLLGRRRGPGRGVLGGRPAVTMSLEQVEVYPARELRPTRRCGGGPHRWWRASPGAASSGTGWPRASSSRGWSRGGRGWSSGPRWCPTCCPPAALWSWSSPGASPTGSPRSSPRRRTSPPAWPRLGTPTPPGCLGCTPPSTNWSPRRPTRRCGGCPRPPDSPGAPALAASGWDRVRGSVEPLAARLRELTAEGYRVVLGAPGGSAGGWAAC